MKSRFSKLFHRRNSRGQTLVFTPIFILALLVIGGLTVDTANGFLMKSKLRRALDASAVAGIVRFSNGVTDINTIQADAEELLRYNLNQMGVPDAQILANTAVFTIDANHVGTLSLTGRIRRPTIFMCLIPNANLAFITVEAAAVSRRYPAVISLVLDTSGSMAGSKLSALKTAAKSFVDSFQEGIDQIALIHFGDTVTILQPMALINKSTLHTRIDSLTSNGWTNIAEAIAEGRIQIELADDPAATFEPIKAMLFFTDGAPNVFRGIFTSAKVPPLVRNYPQPTPVNCDEYLKPGNQPTLVVDGLTETARCAGIGSSADIRNCFTTLRYLDSKLNVRYNSQLISRTSRSEQLKETYNLAIVEADYAKSEGITLYSVGLGSQASEGSDPYQDCTNFNPIKSYFLRRLANDPRVRYNPSFPNLPNPTTHPQGTYLQTPNTSELSALFQTVSTKIKARLVG